MMHAKAPMYLITFHTTADAMALEKLCKDSGFPGRLLPVPRSVTSDCGIAWAVPPERKDALDALIREEKMEFAGKYLVEM